jgi:hypothetical protein
MANLFDAANAPEGEPTDIIVGDFLQWKRSDLTDYKTSDGYTAEYVARITGGGSNRDQDYLKRLGQLTIITFFLSHPQRQHRSRRVFTTGN